MNDDDLLTLDEATAIARYKSVKTLRRAYTRGDLAVVQPVPGGPVRVWRSELMRWLSAPRVMTGARVQDGSPQPPTAPQPRRVRSPARKAAKATAAQAGATGSGASPREPEGAPPRLSLADLSAA